MKLWKLSRIGRVGYDEYAGFVVRAESADAAWHVVHERYLGEDSVQDPADYTYTEVPLDGPPEIILEDFNAG